MPQKSLPPILRFGVFEVNFSAQQLRKHGIRVRLAGQPLAILAMLLERPGEVVTREEMQGRLWASDTFVDFEHSLNSAIKKLRAALGDIPENSRYVETVPRVGYRFIAPVQVIPASENSESGDAVSAELSRGTVELQQEQTSHRRWPVLLGICTIFLTAVGGFYGWSRSRAHSPSSGVRVMLAVLPFENLTGDAGQEYFSDGLTEEMIVQLGHLDPLHLGVIARTSVMHYKRGQQKLDQIGRELGVQYVLEGSVRRDADKVRISAQLIQIKDQTRLWAKQYDRELSNLLVLQGEIAQDIASGIQLTLDDRKWVPPAHQAALTPDAYAAHDLYLKGRYFWNKRTIQGFQQAIEYFQQAIAKDPYSARAYAGLADSYTLLGGYSMVPQSQYMSKARASALRALQIDETLGEAHTSLALITENYDRDWQTAEKEYLRAIELNPNYATAHHWYAEYLTWMGRFDEAFRESERARRLDPLSLIIATDNAMILYYSRQYDRAIDKFRVVREMEPHFPRAEMIVNAYVEKGKFAEALAEADNVPRVRGEWPWDWSSLAYVYGRAGRTAEAQHALEKLQELNRHQEIDQAALAWAYTALGDKDQAIGSLEKAYLQHSNVMTTLKVEPGFDPLRSDPRFQDLLRRVGLAANGITEQRTSKP